MFVIRAKERESIQLEWNLKSIEADIKALEGKYWDLWHKHNLLLAHLGLTEVNVPAKTELRTKGGPERGS